MASYHSLNPPATIEDAGDFVESIFTKHKNSESSADNCLPEWQQWWDCINNDVEVSFILQSGLNSIMNGAYNLATKRVYDTASRKKQVLDKKSNSSAPVSNDVTQRSSSCHQLDERYHHKNDRHYSERERDQYRYHSDYVPGSRKGRSYDNFEPARGFAHHPSEVQRDDITRFRTTADRSDYDENGFYLGMRHDRNRDTRHDRESSSAYHRHRDASNRSIDGDLHGNDRSYLRDIGFRRQEGFFYRNNASDFTHHEHNGRSKNYGENRLTDAHDCDSAYYDRPRHSGSSQTSSQRKSYSHDNGSVHRSSLSTSRGKKPGSHDSRESFNGRRKDGIYDREHRRRLRGDRPQTEECVVGTIDESAKSSAAIPSVAVVKNDGVDQKSMSINGKLEGLNHSSPRSRKNRKSKRRRRSSNHDSNSSISDSSMSSRGSSRRNHRHHSGSSHRRRHSRHGESDDESSSSSHRRRSRRKRKSSRHRHRRSSSDGKADSIDGKKDISNGSISRKKRNPQDQGKER